MKRALGYTIVMTTLAFAGCETTDMPAEPSVSPSDRAAISAAVMDYFEGQGEASFERLDRAFNDNASMFGVAKNDDGEEYLRVWPDMNEVIKRWGANENPPGERDGEILHLNVVDGRIATVQFRSADRFFDALTLVKIDGEWQIAAKVFVRQ